MIIASSLMLLAIGFGPREVMNHYFAAFTFLLALNALLSICVRLSLWSGMGDPLLLLELAIPPFAAAGPVLLMFTARYLNLPSRRANLAATLGLVLVVTVAIPLFQGHMVSNPRLDPNGSMLASTNPWVAMAAAIPGIFLIWSLVLFWKERRRTREPYMSACAAILLTGIILGGVLQIPFPVSSISNLISLIILAYGALGRQLFNPLRKRTVELQQQINERVKAEKALQILNDELEQHVSERTSELQTANEHLTTLTRVKDEFVTNISHELRTPITSIMLYHNLLENKPENALVYVKNLKRETGRLAHLIEDLLTLSRLDQQRIKMNYALVSVNQLIQEYVLDRTPLAAERGLKLNIEDIPDLPQVQADEKMLGQVLSVLLTNAFNYTPPGGTVTVRALMQQYEDQAWIGIAVSDTGPGIPAEEHERVFERFYRGKSGRESNTAGTGLGLSIAREIIQRHQGHIELQSEGGMGRGATFTFWLPVPPPI